MVKREIPSGNYAGVLVGARSCPNQQQMVMLYQQWLPNGHGVTKFSCVSKPPHLPFLHTQQELVHAGPQRWPLFPTAICCHAHTLRKQAAFLAHRGTSAVRAISSANMHAQVSYSHRDSWCLSLWVFSQQRPPTVTSMWFPIPEVKLS